MTREITGKSTFTAVILFFFFSLISTAPAAAQDIVCGDTDCSGKYGLNDMTILIDHFFMSHSTLYCPENCDLDGCDGVTYADLFLMKRQLDESGHPYCVITLLCLPEMPNDSIELRAIGQPIIGGGISQFRLDMYVHNTVKIYGISARLVTTPNVVLDSTARTFLSSHESPASYQFYDDAPGNGEPGSYYLQSYYFTAVGWQSGDSAIFDFQEDLADTRTKTRFYRFPDVALNSIEYEPQWSGPLVVRDIFPSECCGYYTGGFTGNTDCSPDGKRNLSDINRLIDYVYISKAPLCCPDNGNVDGMPGINLADITALIDHIYISKNETAPCE